MAVPTAWSERGCRVLFAAMVLAIGVHAIAADFRELRERVAERCELVVRVGKESESCWSQVCAAAKPVDLGCDLSAMRQVVAISASPDRKWLAVLSVGEGHPMLEVIALDVLRERREFRVMTTVNPFPGTIGIATWRAGELFVTSDMPLPELPLAEGDPAARMGTSDDVYAIDLATWKVRRVDASEARVPGAAN